MNHRELLGIVRNTRPGDGLAGISLNAKLPGEPADDTTVTAVPARRAPWKLVDPLADARGDARNLTGSHFPPAPTVLASPLGTPLALPAEVSGLPTRWLGDGAMLPDIAPGEEIAASDASERVSEVPWLAPEFEEFEPDETATGFSERREVGEQPWVSPEYAVPVAHEPPAPAPPRVPPRPVITPGPGEYRPRRGQRLPEPPPVREPERIDPAAALDELARLYDLVEGAGGRRIGSLLKRWVIPYLRDPGLVSWASRKRWCDTVQQLYDEFRALLPETFGALRRKMLAVMAWLRGILGSRFCLPPATFDYEAWRRQRMAETEAEWGEAWDPRAESYDDFTARMMREAVRRGQTTGLIVLAAYTLAPIAIAYTPAAARALLASMGKWTLSGAGHAALVRAVPSETALVARVCGCCGTLGLGADP